jgi:hypothetical protein
MISVKDRIAAGFSMDTVDEEDSVGKRHVLSAIEALDVQGHCLVVSGSRIT